MTLMLFSCQMSMSNTAYTCYSYLLLSFQTYVETLPSFFFQLLSVDCGGKKPTQDSRSTKAKMVITLYCYRSEKGKDLYLRFYISG